MFEAKQRNTAAQVLNARSRNCVDQHPRFKHQVLICMGRAQHLQRSGGLDERRSSVNLQQALPKPNPLQINQTIILQPKHLRQRPEYTLQRILLVLEQQVNHFAEINWRRHYHRLVFLPGLSLQVKHYIEHAVASYEVVGTLEYFPHFTQDQIYCMPQLHKNGFLWVWDTVHIQFTDRYYTLMLGYKVFRHIGAVKVWVKETQLLVDFFAQRCPTLLYLPRGVCPNSWFAYNEILFWLTTGHHLFSEAE